MKKKRVPKEVSAYFSKIGKQGYRAKVKKILDKAKVETNKSNQ
jgi:hypothetical protein